MDERELAKQLSTYADSFTAFSIVQGATFCFLSVQSERVGCALHSRWYIAEPLLLLAGAGYWWLLHLCHRGEDDLIGVPANRDEKIKNIIPVIRTTRVVLIAIATLGETALVIGAAFFSAGLDCGCKL
jgi:hypothetical protein